MFGVKCNSLCLLLQPYNNGKPCISCGSLMTRGTRTSHWEGGLGCRNKAKMSRYIYHMTAVSTFYYVSVTNGSKDSSKKNIISIIGYSFFSTLSVFRNDRQKYVNTNKTVSRKAASEKN